MSTEHETENVREKVRTGYARIAQTEPCGSGASTCCGTPAVGAEVLARHIGYSTEELAALPDGANLGLSCGNPQAIAALQAGEVVLDLGAGGGFDAFIAGRKVGAAGRVLGVDMTAEMLTKARQNLAAYRERSGLDNVEFRLGEIEHLPVADSSVDVVISNCVLNLSPEKAQVWREIARVLKPGGRVAVSDLALRRPLPPAVAKDVEALIGCVAGAALIDETVAMAQAAGLTHLELIEKREYIEGMVDWQEPLYLNIVAALPPGTRPSDFVTSLEVKARKPVTVSAPVVDRTPPAARLLQVYDPAMCCSTGVCGPQVDPALVQFAADLKWLQEQGVTVQRFNLAQSPAAFVENDLVRAALTASGEAALPMLVVDGVTLAGGRYPTRPELAAACRTVPVETTLLSPAVTELIAIGAAIASHCEPCLRQHVRQAEKLGVCAADIQGAVELAATIKQVPHRDMLRLAAQLTEPGKEPCGGDECDERGKCDEGSSKTCCCS